MMTDIEHEIRLSQAPIPYEDQEHPSTWTPVMIFGGAFAGLLVFAGFVYCAHWALMAWAGA